MADTCFTSLCFILIFYASFELLAGSAAPDPPPQLACNVTKNPDGSVTYQLDPSPTVTDSSSSSWANITHDVFARDGNITAEVLNLTRDSVTLKRCLGEVNYRNDGKTLQEGSCHVNCSGDARTTPSAAHRWCLSVDLCPPVWAAVLIVLAPVVVLALLVVLVVLVVRYKRSRHRCMRGPEEELSGKSSSAAAVQLLDIKSVE